MNDQREEEASGVISPDDNENKKEEPAESSSLQAEEKQLLVKNESSSTLSQSENDLKEENKQEETQSSVHQQAPEALTNQHYDTAASQYHPHAAASAAASAAATCPNHNPSTTNMTTHLAVPSSDNDVLSFPNGAYIPSHHLVPSQQQQQYFQPQQHPSMMMDATRQYFEARMRDHAAAYASAAAGAAWAAAQMAAAAADFAAGNGPPPPPHQLMLAAQQQQQQLLQSWSSGPPPFGDVPPSAAFANPPPPLSYQQPPLSYQQPLSPMMGVPINGGPSPSNGMMAPHHPWDVLPSPQSYQAPQEALRAFPDESALMGTTPNEATRRSQNHSEMVGRRGSRHDDPDADDEVEGDDDDVSSSYQHRRKRRPQHFASSSDQDAASIPRKVVVAPQQQQQQQRGKIRRRLRSDGDSSSSGSSFYYSSRRYNNNSNSSSKYYSSRRTYNQKKKARSDESLLGKTAVAALYEWCSRRSHIIMPVFVLQQQQQEGSKGEEFECTVYLDEQQEKVWGKGRGTNKNAAKQEAAQQALQALCPEVLFDEATGLVKEVPSMPSTLLQTQQRSNFDGNKSNSNNKTNSSKNNSLEDLAPHLAKQLAIGSSNTPATVATGTSSTLATIPTSRRPPRQLHSQLKRSLELHSGGGTTTTSTSDEDDEDSYYRGSRGASVLSGLLFRIISIDPRTPNPPLCVYHFDPNNSSLKRKTNVEKNTRGRFTCTAQLEVHHEKEETPGRGEIIDAPRDQKDTAGQEAESESKGNDTKPHDNTLVQILSAQGAGASKREARQIACAHLLALLFPECETMVDVKEAAEARHALYAANKLKKNVGGGRNIEFALALPSDPPLPLALLQDLETVLNQSTFADENSSEEHESDKKCTSSLGNSSTLALRQHGRKMQLDAMVEKTLQNLNERDEGGRCLPEELTDDDVGRTVLRRAEPGDMDWIRKLLLNIQRGGHSPESTKLFSASKKDSHVEVDQECNEHLDDVFARLWLPSSIVLLLCRAIAAYEDPPLGCAVLTVDFCLERGRLLCITRLATESHLPQERFLECLQDFAGCMQCELELHPEADRASAASIRLTRSDNKRIIRSYLNKSESDKRTAYTASTSPINVANLTLQSVQEEDSELSDSSAEKRPARPPSKPSKRSRFQ